MFVRGVGMYRGRGLLGRRAYLSAVTVVFLEIVGCVEAYG